MKVLSNHWPYALLIGFAIFCFIWWMCKFSAAKFPEDLLVRQASEFRNNAFIGFDDRDLEKSFGRPLHSVVLEHVGEEDFFGSSGISVGSFMPPPERLALCLWSLERCWMATEFVCWSRTA